MSEPGACWAERWHLSPAWEQSGARDAGMWLGLRGRRASCVLGGQEKRAGVEEDEGVSGSLCEPSAGEWGDAAGRGPSRGAEPALRPRKARGPAASGVPAAGELRFGEEGFGGRLGRTW